MNLLSDKNAFKCSVSSVLNKDIKQYGKNFMFDKRNDTSWMSDHGTPQWIAFSFSSPTSLSSLKIQFQGGFAGKDCLLWMYDDVQNLLKSEPIYPEDINSIQEFKLENPVNGVTVLKIEFNTSTDFFGRIIIYDLEIY